MRLSTTLLLTMILSGCSQFKTGRSYMSEMEHDDTPYFTAGADFPVLGGDTGRTWRGEKEQRKRTPASVEDLQENRAHRALKAELRRLEDGQNEHGIDLYEKHKNKFSTVSEKIYFLKLSTNERYEYLGSRGFIAESPSLRVQTSKAQMHAERRSNIMLGMSKAEVKGNFGKPSKVEVAGNPSYENERWVYSNNGATKYIYFESGKVGGWD
ncbi:MAG TPA: hypothetical protein VNJ08_08710 [Bacteriovoracaceae bacterium]|nr:hypothetical protein [Bacteriovoracaceae bacterium]